MKQIRWMLVLVLLVPGVCCGQARYEEKPISYSDSEPSDKVFQLGKLLSSEETELQWDSQHGYLKSLLRQLKIPANSQSLVFSKTSLQVSRISPSTPRAIYFNDDIYVGWVQRGSVIEISAADPKLGATFYSIKQNEFEKPKILRETSRCLQCHGGTHTRGRPGHIVRSVYPNETGMPEYGLGTKLVSPGTRLSERLGGWFVTGTHGDLRHRGNSWMPKSNASGLKRFHSDATKFDIESGANLKNLDELVDLKPYLQPTSDIVAQLVLHHQVHMHNVLTAANYSGQQAVYDAKVMNKLFERGDDYESDSTLRRYKSAAEKVVKALLFCDEIEFTNQIVCSNSFPTEFTKTGPFDKQGRTLREFDLQTRLFRYPCSFLIYSDAFNALPEGVISRVKARLWEVLSGEEDSKEFAHINADDKKSILQILQGTGITVSKLMSDSKQ